MVNLVPTNVKNVVLVMPGAIKNPAEMGLGLIGIIVVLIRD
jgi:hypothetical protein